MDKTAVVIGGGPAGMMSAVTAAENGYRVTLIEKNEKLGKKLFITGKGRCNVTNDCDPDVFFDNVVSNSKFMYSAFYMFDNNMLIDYISSRGCPLKVERGGRVFPVSDHSSDVIKVFSKELDNLGVKVLLNTTVKDIIVDTHEDCRICHGVILNNGNRIEADKVILATGGCSYPQTGSTGDGFRILEHYGHSKTELRPGLVPFVIKEDYPKRLQGLALKNVSLKLLDVKSGKILHEDFGEMLFTHFGISGPLVLSASQKYNYGEPTEVVIDLKPALSREQLDKRVLRDFEDNTNKSLKNAIGGLMPSSMIPVIIEVGGLDENKPVHSISKEERGRLVDSLKNFKLTVTGTRDFNEAIITRGGIKVKEIDPSTMESKLISNLYLAGEVLDLDAYTGGFNLQIAWSTGHLAGMSLD